MSLYEVSFTYQKNSHSQGSQVVGQITTASLLPDGPLETAPALRVKKLTLVVNKNRTLFVSRNSEIR